MLNALDIKQRYTWEIVIVNPINETILCLYDRYIYFFSIFKMEWKYIKNYKQRSYYSRLA